MHVDRTAIRLHFTIKRLFLSDLVIYPSHTQPALCLLTQVDEEERKEDSEEGEQKDQGPLHPHTACAGTCLM